MSTIRKVGSALKRAALYVPRRIASRLQNIGRYNYSELHLNPHTSLEEHRYGNFMLTDERKVRKVENVRAQNVDRYNQSELHLNPHTRLKEHAQGDKREVSIIEKRNHGRGKITIITDVNDRPLINVFKNQKPKRGFWENPALELTMLGGYLKAVIGRLFKRK